MTLSTIAEENPSRKGPGKMKLSEKVSKVRLFLCFRSKYTTNTQSCIVEKIEKFFFDIGLRTVIRYPLLKMQNLKTCLN